MLGPVHYQMYEKIKLENELIEDIQKEFSLEKNYAETYAPLEQVIDLNNIHNWIQSHMEDVERRLAAVCEDVLKDQPIDQLLHTAYLTGYRHSISAPDAKSAYQVIDAALLNGMPCDDVIEITRNDENLMEWHEKMDMHGNYWKDPSIYRKLRSAFTEGLLAKSGLQYAENEGSYSISGTMASL